MRRSATRISVFLNRCKDPEYLASCRFQQARCPVTRIADKPDALRLIAGNKSPPFQCARSFGSCNREFLEYGTASWLSCVFLSFVEELRRKRQPAAFFNSRRYSVKRQNSPPSNTL